MRSCCSAAAVPSIEWPRGCQVESQSQSLGQEPQGQAMSSHKLGVQGGVVACVTWGEGSKVPQLRYVGSILQRASMVLGRCLTLAHLDPSGNFCFGSSGQSFLGSRAECFQVLGPKPCLDPEHPSSDHVKLGECSESQNPCRAGFLEVEPESFDAVSRFISVMVSTT